MHGYVPIYSRQEGPRLTLYFFEAGGIAGIIGNPGGMLMALI